MYFTTYILKCLWNFKIVIIIKTGTESIVFFPANSNCIRSYALPVFTKNLALYIITILILGFVKTLNSINFVQYRNRVYYNIKPRFCLRHQSQLRAYNLNQA